MPKRTTSLIARRRPGAVARLGACLAAIALVAALGLAATASAAVKWVIHGRGFGHGVGMSVYGEIGRAHV